MSKQEAPKNSSFDFEDSTQRRQKLGEIRNSVSKLEKSRVSRTIINTSFRVLFYSVLLTTRSGREMLMDAERRRFLYDREERIGLLEDSIISDELYIPNEAGTSLEQISAVAGRFVGYDFHRPKEFKSAGKKRERQVKRDGKLWTFAINEVSGNDINDYTPTDLFNIFNPMHFLSLDIPTIDEATDQGFLQETTYRQAYEKVGMYPRYRQYLELQGISDRTIYTVTPKGNGLVFLVTDGGEKRNQEDKVGELKPSLSFPSF